MGFSKKVRGISLRVVAVLLVCLAIGSVIAYIFVTVKFPVNVEEPLSVVGYPNSLELFPNMTQSFNITINNAAPVNYLVALDFSLNDTVYQESYVTFSNETYTVIPGLSNATAWLSVAPDAPPAQLELTVTLSRVEAEEETFGYTFTWTNETQAFVNGTLVMKVDFKRADEKLLVTVQINDTHNANLSDPYSDSELDIAFDVNFNGRYDDGGYVLYSDNTVIFGSYPYVQVWQSGRVQYTAQGFIPIASPYHNATFDNATGWTYHIAFPKTELPQKSSIYDLAVGLRIHICYMSYSWRTTPYLGNVFVDFLYQMYGSEELW
jgi:hypothetical protein